jgi:hypothetical protein
MAISERNQKLFEGIGLETVRRELATRVYYYLSSGSSESLDQAREWVADQEHDLAVAEDDRYERETKLLAYTRWTLAAAIVAAVAAVASLLLPR